MSAAGPNPGNAWLLGHDLHRVQAKRAFAGLERGLGDSGVRRSRAASYLSRSPKSSAGLSSNPAFGRRGSRGTALPSTHELDYPKEKVDLPRIRDRARAAAQPARARIRSGRAWQPVPGLPPPGRPGLVAWALPGCATTPAHRRAGDRDPTGKPTGDFADASQPPPGRPWCGTDSRASEPARQDSPNRRATPDHPEDLMPADAPRPAMILRPAARQRKNRSRP